MSGLRAWVTYATYRALGELMGALPEVVAAAGAAVVGEVMARRGGPAREMRTRHMARVLASASPAADPDPGVVDRWVRRSFRAYARYWLEGARLPSAGGRVEQRMVFARGLEHLDSALSAGNGVVLVLPHVGSWEWGGAWLARTGRPMTSVAERLEPPKLFDWFLAERRAMGLVIVPLGEEAGPELLKTLRNRGLVGLLCDRDIAGDGIEVDLFGETTTIPGGPATLALRTGAALLPAAVYSGPGRDHTAVVSPPLDMTRQGSFRSDVRRITQDIADALEKLIRVAPDQWHLYQPNWPSDEVAADARSSRTPSAP